MESLGPLPLLLQECELTRARSERLPLCQFWACLIAQAAGVQLLSWEGMCFRNFRGDMFPKCREGFQMPQDKTMITALTTASALVSGRTGLQKQAYADKEKPNCSPSHVIGPLNQPGFGLWTLACLYTLIWFSWLTVSIPLGADCLSLVNKRVLPCLELHRQSCGDLLATCLGKFFQSFLSQCLLNTLEALVQTCLGEEGELLCPSASLAGQQLLPWPV